jgi:single-strand DNA-binding protein
MINRVTLVGRLTRDPEVHDTAAGGHLVNMRLVTTEYRKAEVGARKEEVQYHSVIAFSKLAEVCADYLRKGRLVYIEGKLRTREWDGKDGIHRYTTEVIADHMQMLSPRPPEDQDDDAANGKAADGIVAGAGA